MAIYNPSDLYGGAAFRIDTTPMLNFLVKKQAKEDAKAAALDKYYRDAVKPFSDKNIRGADIPAFGAAITDYQNFYIKNADQLSRNKSPELSMEADRKINTIRQILADSRPQKDVEEKIGQQSQLLGKDFMDLWTDKTHQDYTKSTEPAWIPDPQTGAPIKNPNWTPFDLSKIERHPKVVNLNEFYSKTFNDLGYKPSETIIGEELVEGSEFVFKGTKKYSYDPTALKNYGDAVKGSYNNDESLQYSFTKGQTFDQLKNGDINKWNELNAIYKPIYGTDMKEDEDIFAANAIKTMAQTRTEPYRRIDEDAKLKVQARISRENSAALAKAVAKAKSAGVSIDINKLPTALNRFPSGTAVARKTNIPLVIKDGIWVDNKGKLFTGEVILPTSRVPIEINDIINKRDLYSEASIYIENGVPVNVSTEGGTVGKELLQEGEINKKIKQKQLNKTSFVPSTSGSVGQDLTTNENNDKLNLSI